MTSSPLQYPVLIRPLPNYVEANKLITGILDMYDRNPPHDALRPISNYMSTPLYFGECIPALSKHSFNVKATLLQIFSKWKRKVALTPDEDVYVTTAYMMFINSLSFAFVYKKKPLNVWYGVQHAELRGFTSFGKATVERLCGKDADEYARTLNDALYDNVLKLRAIYTELELLQ